MDSDKIFSRPKLTADAITLAELTETIECAPRKVEDLRSTSENISTVDDINSKSSVSVRKFEASDDKNDIKIDQPDEDESDDSENAEDSDEEQLAIEKTTNQKMAEDVDGEKVELDKAGDGIDPYSYLQRGDFSSEIYKIELTNLPRKFGIGQLKKKLVFLGLHPCKIKSVDSSHYAFVTFRSEEHREKAMEVLEGHVWKNQTLHCKKAAANADPLQLKRRLDASAEGSEERRAKVPKTENNDEQLSPAEMLNNAVTPLWKMDYSDQLRVKEKSISQFIKKVGKQIEKNCPSDRHWLNTQRKINKGLCCKQFPIKPSPVVNGYRNKCEFTIGVSLDGTDNVVGFRLGSYRAGVLSVLEPTDCVNIPDSMKRVCKDLQTFLQEGPTATRRSAFNPSDRTGHWQMATVRTAGPPQGNGAVMLSVVIHPQSLTEQELKDEKARLREHFDSLPVERKVSSLHFVVESDRREVNTEGECEHLAGTKYIEENLLGMTFRISPSAFFQVNSAGAEVLYQTIADWCDGSPESTLLDICCGTGTIGLTVAKRMKAVIGVELCPRAIEDAKANALLNGVTNAEFLCGKAEDVLPTLMYRFSDPLDRVVVVVDPPRAGLHADVVRAIRKSACVRRLVYVSCKPSAATQNIVDFTRMKSRRFLGTPFRFVAAVPVDMFPHTEHCELIMLFERSSEGGDACGQQGLTESIPDDDGGTHSGL